MTHIWWGCPRIQSFWVAVLDIIHRITGIRIENEPMSLLLSMLPLPNYVLKPGLISFLLIAAKTVIPRLWKSTQTPTIADWYKEIFFLQRMEELRADSHGSSVRNTLVWSTWVTFTTSPEFVAGTAGATPITSSVR